MHQNIKEYNLINSIINSHTFEQTQVSKNGPQLLLENDMEQQQLARAAEEDKIAQKKAREAKIKKNNAESAALAKVTEDSEGSSMSKDDIKEKIAELTERIAELRKKLDDGNDEESIDEDCPHTDGHDHNEDYCAMVKSQLGKLSQMSGMIASMIPKDSDLPEGVKEKISAAMSSLSGAAAAMQSSASRQDDERSSNQPRPAERKITTFNVRPISAPQRMAGFSFNPPSTQNYEEYND